MAKQAKTYVDENGIPHWTGVLIVDDSPENADWIKVAGWFRTFSEDERHLLETFKGCSSSLCKRAWLLQRQYRLTHGKLGAEIVTDPDLHKALLLMRAAGIPCDRMHPDDDWNFPGYMKEPVPDVTPYYIDPDVSPVTAWSTACIPFEPKGWRLDFRNDLRKAIARLPSRQGKVLSATYRSAISEGADVENLLIYNVFNAKLSRVAREGLIFERFDEVPPDCPTPLSSQALCQYEYRLVDDRPMSPEGQGGHVLASVSFELPARVPESPATVWYAAKMAGIVVTRGSYVNKPWGILISMRAPSSSRITCSNIVKPLIDGIASALHFHDGSDIDCLSKRLGMSLGFPDGTLLKALLQDDTTSLFGETNLLCRHGDNVQWNPRDEYCTYCSMKCLHDLPGTRLEVAVRVFDMTYHEAT